MTVILGRVESPWIGAFAAHLRRRGLKVLALKSVGVVGFLMYSQRVAALVLHEGEVAADCARLQARFAALSSSTRILRIARDDARSFDQLADAVLGCARAT